MSYITTVWLQGGNQYWLMSREGEIRRDEACLDYGAGKVVLYTCHGSRGNQEWRWEGWGGLLHLLSGRCLAVSERQDTLLMEPCSRDDKRQQWSLENFNKTVLA